MEESLNEGLNEGLRSLADAFGVTQTDPDGCPPLTLAYIGDAVFEVIIRYVVICRRKVPVNRLHAAASHIVCAESQSKMMAVIEPLLDEHELAVYKRGRNAKSHTTAKNASITEYRRATGFEALIGWLFLKEQYGRLITLCEIGQRDISIH